MHSQTESGLSELVHFPKWMQWPGVGQAEARNLEFHPDFPHRLQRPKQLGPASMLPQVHQQPTASEVEQVGLKQVLLWDANSTDGSIIYSDTTWAQVFISLSHCYHSS